jgi:hypothetical protein
VNVSVNDVGEVATAVLGAGLAETRRACASTAPVAIHARPAVAISATSARRIGLNPSPRRSKADEQAGESEQDAEPADR